MNPMAWDSQRCLLIRVLDWPGLRPLRRNPQGDMVGDVVSGSGGLMSMPLEEVGKAHARASLRVFWMVHATSGSYLKSRGRIKVTFSGQPILELLWVHVVEDPGQVYSMCDEAQEGIP